MNAFGGSLVLKPKQYSEGPSWSAMQYRKFHAAKVTFKVFDNHRKSLIQHCERSANYVYILSGQKLIKNVKNPPFWRVFENLKLVVKQCYQTLRQVSYNRTKSLWSFVHFDVKIRRLKYLEIVGRINKNFDVKIQFKRNIFIDL